jgi:hypothetical protein
MSRRLSRSPLFLIVVFLLFVALYVAYRIQTQKQTQSQPKEEAERQGPKRKERPDYRQQSAEDEEPSVAPRALCSSTYFNAWQEPTDGACEPTVRNGYPVPDPRCTPGGFNSAVTAETLLDPDWRTGSIRNCESSEAEKHIAYRWYGIAPPHGNFGRNQVCELDHLVPLELGGADGLGNVWPQCGPDGATLRARYFKAKDRVENDLAREVKAGRMSLLDAQRGIASDWTQYLPEIGN